MTGATTPFDDDDQNVLAPSGASVALFSKSPRETWLLNDKFADATRTLLGGSFYQVVYRGNIASHSQNRVLSTGTRLVAFQLLPECGDFVNRVDLILDGVDSVKNVLKRIDVNVGYHRFDSLNVQEDLDTQIRVNSAFFGRRYGVVGNKLFVPLTMAPLHSTDLVRTSGTHEVRIIVHFHENASQATIDGARLAGCVYSVDAPLRKTLFSEPHEFVTFQNQYAGVETLKRGRNEIKLRFNYPTAAMFFWGFDKKLVTNVKLTLNALPFYDGDVETLDHFKLARGIDVDPVMIFFSQADTTTPHRSSVNFSSINNAKLIIDTTDVNDTNLYIVTLNPHPGRYANGMYGLQYSK